MGLCNYSYRGCYIGGVGLCYLVGKGLDALDKSPGSVCVNVGWTGTERRGLGGGEQGGKCWETRRKANSGGARGGGDEYSSCMIPELANGIKGGQYDGSVSRRTVGSRIPGQGSLFPV